MSLHLTTRGVDLEALSEGYYDDWSDIELAFGWKLADALFEKPRRGY